MPQVVSVVVGMQGAEQARQSVDRMSEPISEDLWTALTEAGHIRMEETA